MAPTTHPTTWVARLSICAALSSQLVARASATPCSQERDAEDEQVDLPVKTPQTSWSWEVDAGFLHMPRVDAGPIRVGSSRVGLNVIRRFPVGDRTHVSVGLGSERASYDIDGLSQAIPGAGRHDLSVFDMQRVSINAVHVDSPSVSYFAGLGATVSRAPGADLNDSTLANAQVGVTYKATERTTVSLGAAASSRLEAQALVLPIVGVQWQASERWSASLGVPATEISFRATDSLSLALRGRFDFRDYRLNDSGALDGGVFRDQAIGVEFGADWRIDDSVSLRVGVGVPLDRELQLKNKRGHSLLTVSPDPIPFFAISLRARL